jgi:hypothetical protein
MWVAGVCAVGATFARSDLALAAGWVLTPRWFALPAILPLAIAGVVLTRPLRVAPALTAVLSLGALAWSAGVAATPLSSEWKHSHAVEAPVRGLRLARIAVEPKHAAWLLGVRERTPAYAQLLIPPSLGEFRLGARRGVYVDWKCVPVRGDEVQEWQRRMLTALGVASLPGVGYELRRNAERIYLARPLADLEALARREGLPFLVAARDAAPVPGLERSVAGAKWRLYRLRTPAEKRLHERVLRHRARMMQAPLAAPAESP